MTSRVARLPYQNSTPKRRHPSQPSSPSLAALRARYVLLDRLGAGCAGTVVHAVDKASRQDVAVKIVPKRVLVDKACKIALAREVSVLSKLRHAHVVGFSNAFEDDSHVYIANEYCPSGDLYQLLKKRRGGLPEREALKYLRQILHGLAYLHSLGISHRDVKPENVLLSDNGKLKLADFGMCYWRRPGSEMTTRQHCGTPQYAAPEILRKLPYVPEQGDMWACGVVLYAMLTCTLPFDGADWNDLKYSIVNSNAEAIARCKSLAHVSGGTKTLLCALLSFKPSHRPSATVAIELLDDALLGVRTVRRTVNKTR